MRGLHFLVDSYSRGTGRAEDGGGYEAAGGGFGYGDRFVAFFEESGDAVQDLADLRRRKFCGGRHVAYMCCGWVELARWDGLRSLLKGGWTCGIV